MPTLKPDQRLDRNGRLVTRWVRDGAQSSFVPLAIPSPGTASTTRAIKETMSDLEEFFRHCQISREHSAQVLRRIVPLMSENNASELVHGLWEDFNSFGNVRAVAGMLDRIYGSDSSIPLEHRDTAFKNLIDIIPPYGMNYEDENNDIIEYTWVIFNAVGGEQHTVQFTKDEKIAYQSAACVTNHIFRGTEAPYDLESYGFTRTGANNDELALNGAGAIDALLEGVGVIESLRDSLMERGTLHPEVIREMVASGILNEGAL